MRRVTLSFRDTRGENIIFPPEGTKIVLENLMKSDEKVHYKAYEVWRVVDDLFWASLEKGVRIDKISLPQDWPREVVQLIKFILCPMFEVIRS
jgi:hypothetical protein